MNYLWNHNRTLLYAVRDYAAECDRNFESANNDDVEELYFEFAKRVSYTLIID